jgi:hypothetical protein
MIRRHRRLLALTAVVVLAVTGCSRNDAKESDVVNAMHDAGLTDEQSTCIGNGLDAAFGDDQDLFNKVASASSVDDLPDGTEKQITTVLDDCLQEGGSTSSSTSEGGDGGSSTTATTESGNG